MVRLTPMLAALCVLWGGLDPVALAQFGGSRAGQEGHVAEVADLPVLEREVAEAFITVEGRAEVRVPPTEIRVVLAVTGEGETAQECQQTVRATIERVTAAWRNLGIAEDAIVEDFIAVLPRYEWTVEEHEGLDVAIEQLAGYRMQTNLHLAVPGQTLAQAALSRAFELGITDIIAFDYWSKDLDDVQRKAREQAVQAARSKAEVLLGPLFESLPPIINVQEQTSVRYPSSLYDSFTSSHDQSVTPSLRRDVPLIRAARPQNTYYRGLFSTSDIGPAELPMRPEISVISTVRLYFESPAATRKEAAGSR